ncbi:hypothetical protein P280DRAFT_550432 [Massarina eburnea CBS 473.64]|uniref:Cupin type-2 domain-containing protein n=1 Tax=Massarina eburnea CBS 473.64 TaxID=1395130 RepID=A0A6A6RY92_9PLEO|nr:hypothetical protein P280DRAFT_550432 [Massarina eburnea CBS 473.64]
MATKTGLPKDVRPADTSMIPPGILDSKKRKIYNPVQKNWAYIQKYGRETQGAYGIGTGSLQPGGENGAHWHGSYSETFTSLKGDVGVYSASRGKVTLQPGDSVTVKPGEVHYFFNDGDEEVEFQTKIEPAHEGFEKALYVMYGLARDGKGGNAGVANGLMDTAVICSMGDMWPGGMTGALVPLLKILGWWGRVSGKQKALVDKYWVGA